MIRVDWPPNVSTGRHTHPGDEYGTVLEGTLISQDEGGSGRPITPGTLTTKSRGSCTRRRVAISLPNHLTSLWSKRASRWFNQRVSDTATPLSIAAHHLAIDQAGPHLEVVDGLDHEGKSGRAIVARSAECHRIALRRAMSLLSHRLATALPTP